MAAGIHHPGTALALRMLGRDFRDKAFEKHPYGGVIRVQLDMELPFAERVENATWKWEDEADEARTPADDQGAELQDNLAKIATKRRNGELTSLELDHVQAENCLRLLRSLSEPSRDVS